MINTLLTMHEKDQLLAFFSYHMSAETRRTLMHELPQAYNNLIGRDVVKVVLVATGEEIER